MKIIEQLKKNEKPFGLMSEEMQEKAREIGRNQFQHWLDEWNKCSVSPTMNQHFLSEKTYRLRSDYVEEPEVVKCEVYFADSGELEYRNTNKTGSWLLADAPNDPDFIGFELGGQLWGRLYKNKEYGTYAITIDAGKFDKYDVCDTSNAKVLFKGKQ